MSDDQSQQVSPVQQASQAPQPQATLTAQSAPAKDPLAVLEELLAKQKQDGAGGGTAGGAGAPDAGGQAQPDAAAVAAQRQAEYERIQAESAARDAELLAAQATKMEELKSTPEYQARVAQNEEKAAEQQEQAADQDGYQIVQVQSKRVPVPGSD